MMDFDGLDEVLLEFEDDLEEEEDVGTGLALTPVTAPRPSFTSPPYDAREALSLVEEADKLFDFRKTRLTPLQQLYIISYATRATRTGACKMAGVTYGTVEAWMKDDEFVAALDNAVCITQDMLEEELFRRAYNGSDKLLLEAIKALKPHKYQTKTSTDINMKGQILHTWADLAKQASIDEKGGHL